MIQENKDLLLKDLCVRLPYYDLMLQWKGEDFNMIDIGFGRVTLLKPFMSFTAGSPLIEEVKPYLRPMSSMTKEEKKEFCKIEGRVAQYFPCKYIKLIFSVDELDWLNKKMFDYRGLIEKGLALEAPEGMYNIN